MENPYLIEIQFNNIYIKKCKIKDETLFGWDVLVGVIYDGRIILIF
jgi:hypothetical protein